MVDTSIWPCLVPCPEMTVSLGLETGEGIASSPAGHEERILSTGTLDPDRLAILADALEDAGCDNADILNHCRQPGEHVRGCWVVDLVLGKE